jgi:predicted nuclease with TOPRIM domain
LLLKLCRESDQRLTLESERRQAEEGLERIRTERDGNGLSGGLIHRISELRRQQGDLQGRIAALRKPAESLAARIRALEQQRAVLLPRLATFELRLAGLQERVRQLESVQRLRARRDTAATAEETAESLGQWKAITALMAREVAVCRRQESGLLAGAALQLLQSATQVSPDNLLSQRAAVMQQCLEQGLAVTELLQAELKRLTETAGEAVQADESLRLLADTELRAALSTAETERDCCSSELQQLQAELATVEQSLECLRGDLQPALTLETLDQLRATIAELEAETTQLEEQRRQLDQAEETVSELLAALSERPVYSLLETAGAALRRATGGEVRDLSWAVDGGLLVSPGGEPAAVSLHELDAAVQDLVGLVLRLSLLQLRGANVPLILDGVHLHAGESWSAGTAAVLESFAAAGQQILVLAESCDLPDQQGRWLEVRPFPALVVEQLPTEPESSANVAPEPPVISAEEPSTAVAAPLLQLHVGEEVESAAEEPLPAEVADAGLVVLPQSADAHDPHASNWLFYLEADHGIEDLAGISLGELEALRAAGVLTVRDLLTRTIPQLEELARLKGFVVPVERLQALWGQAELAARVPLLRRGDAALLFAAGIHTAEELSRLRPETVYERVTRFQRSESGARFRRAGRLIDRQQALNWARFGQFLRSLEDVFQTRSRFGARTGVKSAVRAAVVRPVATRGESAVVSEAGAKSAEKPVAKKRRRKVEVDAATETRRAKRTARRQQLAAEHRVELPESEGGQLVAERVGGMRFFLSRTSSVASAPSIGPRTAELLQAAGLRTVEEFLSMTPERVSEKLNSRRITAAIVRQWQAQARLMCQIPELRAVDSQILVACGILTPEALSERGPEQVLLSVRPLSESAEGQKLLKTAGEPDLSTVTAWIQWAANARPFRAA